MKNKSILVLAVVVLFFGSSPTTFATTASFQGLGDLPGRDFSSGACAVSADGSVVVGWSQSAASSSEAFRWTSAGGMVGLGSLPGWGFYSKAQGVSADGSVVVGQSYSVSGPEAFRWEDINGNGQVDDYEKLDMHPEFGLGDMPGGMFWSKAWGVSADGSVVVGKGISVSGLEAFRWTSGSGMVGLGDLPGGRFGEGARGVSADGSVVVGGSYSASGLEAFRWTSASGMVGLGDLSGGDFYSWANGVSADGSTVVGQGKSASGTEAFRWMSSGGMVGLGNLPGGSFSEAWGVSADGSVVVGGSSSASGLEAFIWDETNGMRNLKDVLVNELGLNLTGWALTWARGISDDGLTIVGSGNNPSGNVEAWLATIPEPAPGIIYVDADATGATDGTTWADAYNDLQDALTAASSGNQIWVAQGIYKPDEDTVHPTGTGDREATFQLINSVAIKGGYAGFGEPDPNARDIDAYETILSGDLLSNDGPDFANNDENSYHVVIGSRTDATAVLNGFTITAGNIPRGFGGGMFNHYGSPTVTNCIFTLNAAWWGGGMYNFSSSPTLTGCRFIANSAFSPYPWEAGGGMANWDHSSPTLTNCTFSGNSAGDDGGGMFNYFSSSPTLTNCTFSGNLAIDGGGMYNYQYSSPTLNNCVFSGNSASHGGGIYHYGGTPTLTNCTFSGNTAAENGGGIVNTGSNPTITHCTFSGNSAPNGNALACDSYKQSYPSTVYISNCILWDGGNEIWNNDNSEITITYSDVQGGWPGEGNINGDPYFVAGPLGDFYLSQVAAGQLVDSPCVDAGSGDANDPNIGMDEYTTRTDHVRDAGIVDMGYHYVPPTNTAPVANAGEDQTVYTGIDGIAEVTLDGTGSYDDDGDPLTYLWNCTIDDEIITTITTTGSDGIVNMLDFAVLIKQWLRTGNSLADIAPLGGDGLVDILDLSILTQAWLTTPASPNWNPQCDIAPTGATPTIELPCGVYSIELIVNDGIVDSEPDYVEITVLDGTPPVITCPSDVTLECPADTSTVANGSATATDNCDDSPVIVYSDLISGTCPMVIERTWTATDASGNSSTCVQTLTVVDTTPPVITCLPNLTLECPADTSVAATGSATASDACGSVTITHSDVSVPACGNTETITRTWTATDECGNSSTCVQSITVVDTTPPEIEVTVPPVDAALQDGVTLTAASSDTCGDVSAVYFYVREPGGTNGVPIGHEDLPGTLNTTSGKWEYAFDTTQLQDGYYVILAKAIDTCGNEGWSAVVAFSIRNWAVIELLPASESNKAGRTMPVKFALRIVESVDPAMPFVYNEELEIRIYDSAEPTNILQTSVYGDESRDYRIDSTGELYINNFKTKRQPAEYVVEIWRTSKNFLVGSFTFETVK